ncbi:MAG: hypothetical protein AAGG51_09480 [Cyanobacteria bacterium P01_G01_bin.54]
MQLTLNPLQIKILETLVQDGQYPSLEIDPDLRGTPIMGYVIDAQNINTLKK